MSVASPTKGGMPALRVALIAVLTAVLSVAAARAEQRATTGSGADATEIKAGQGIEWQRDKKIYIARGGVVVTRGVTVLQADGMTAYYREAGGKSKIFRIDAIGHVTVRSRDAVVSGDRAVYDLDNKVLTLTGANLSYVAPNSKVTARDSLEYWDEKRMAVARGKAVAVNEDDLIRADVLVAYFNDKDTAADKPATAPGGAKEKKNQVVRYEGFGNVVVESKENVARGEHLTYRVKDGVAVLTGTPAAPPGITRTPGGPPPPATGDLGGRISGQFVPKSDADKPASGNGSTQKPAQPKDGAIKPQQ